MSDLKGGSLSKPEERGAVVDMQFRDIQLLTIVTLNFEDNNDYEKDKHG